jgi:molecular chaperone IbpA
LKILLSPPKSEKVVGMPNWVLTAKTMGDFDHGGERPAKNSVASIRRTSDMRNYDLSPLFRSSIGFDHMNRLINTASKTDVETYPPYNIEKEDEDYYRITMAVAGFSSEDLDLIQKENALFIKGQANIKNTKTEYLHRGIAARSFERRFSIADHVNVMGADLQNGILTIELKREIPEALKPRKIKILSGDSCSGPIEQKAA